MPRLLKHAPFELPPVLRSPVALFAAVVAASVVFSVTHLIWLSEYVSP